MELSMYIQDTEHAERKAKWLLERVIPEEVQEISGLVDARPSKIIDVFLAYLNKSGCTLAENELDIFKRRNGISPYEACQSCGEIAGYYGKTREEIKEIEESAIRGLRETRGVNWS